MNYENQCSCIICKQIKPKKGIFSHYIISHTEEGKKRNNESIKKRQMAGRKKRNENINDIIISYSNNPSYCKECWCCLSYYDRNRPFCGSSCAATYNNIRKGPRSESTKQNISKGLKNRDKSKPADSTKRSAQNRKKILHNDPKPSVCHITYKNCDHCGKPFYVRGITNKKKGCSRICSIALSTTYRTYQNGRRKIFYYFNKHQNKEVMLESSWEKEIAEFLDFHNVVWIRPTYIVYKTDKDHLYFPDFYLPDYNLYLDPKNPNCLALSIEKMNIVSSLIPLIYGDKDMIKDEILKLTRLA
jgi:hypothetical protein